jgi:putative membrane protein
MQKSRILPIAFTSAALLVQFGGAARAQGPGGQAGSAQQQNASRPSAENPATAADSTPAKVDDKKFLKDAAVGGMTEVELGKLATQKASSDQVKQFGQKMVDDHGKANEALKQVASKESIQIPDSLDAKHQSRIDKLAKLSGADFDKAYMKDQVKDHEKDVSDFQSEAKGGSDPTTQQFAATTLPTLQQHLELAKSINKTTKSGGK